MRWAELRNVDNKARQSDRHRAHSRTPMPSRGVLQEVGILHSFLAQVDEILSLKKLWFPFLCFVDAIEDADGQRIQS